MTAIINTKQIYNQLKKSLDNFQLQERLTHCNNEAQTRSFLIEPFFELLNYSKDKRDLIPEFEADFGDRISNKVDYAIFLNKKESLLIECKKCKTKLSDKEAGQLNGYFSNTKSSRIAVLTNGIEYRFYSDIISPNIIDPKPFFVFNLEDYDESAIEKLLNFDKRIINIKNIIESAQDIVFIENFEKAFFNEVKDASSELLRIVYKRMDVKIPFNDRTKVRMKELINSTLFKSIFEKMMYEETKTNSSSAGIITTSDELQGYHMIRTILIQNNKIPKERICYKDQRGSFNILLDDNQRKIICKLIFSDNLKKIIIENNEYLLENIDALLKHKKELTDRTLALI
jgi:hypothetical protein